MAPWVDALMDHLYTPWRMRYIRGETKAKQGDGCIFCDAPAQTDADALIIARSTHVYALLNLYPYNNGHLMVVPYQHVQTPESLSAEALTDLMLTVNRALGALRALYNPTAFNLGANIGAAAGAGIAAHYHFHVVPRWSGDANFMTVVGETRVIPDTHENTQRALQAKWQGLYGTA
jgi:ATP adenylyltransferase